MKFLRQIHTAPALFGMMLFLGLAFAATESRGQGAAVVTAYNYLKEGDYLKAKEYIDKAAEHEKTKGKAKTWYYRGMVYENIYFKQDEEYKPVKPGSLQKAYESYKTARTIPSKSIDTKDLERRYFRLANFFFQEGVNRYNDKKYKEAKDNFKICMDIKEEASQMDTLALYNYGLAAEFNGEIDLAIETYKKAIEVGYKPQQVYGDIIKIYQDQGQEDNALSMLKEARTKYPNNQNFITTEINFFLKNERYDEALENLNLAVQNDAENAVLYYARGYIYNERGGKAKSTKEEKTANLEKAEADYLKAIELDAEYFDANYNLGALYYNIGADVINDANDISNIDAYNKEKERANGYFEKSIPYLEKAHELDAKNKAAMQSLKELYARTGQNDKYKAMNEKLNN